MSRKWMAAAALLVLMLSVCVFALAEEPTDPVYPVPGPLEKHEHTVSVKIIDRGYTAHRLQEWCPACGRLLKERLEGHNFVDGVCTVCDWECPHPPEAAEKHYERDGVKPQWDGNYIICPGWEITECGVCRTVLSRVETTVREFHNVHTHFTPVLECLPHDADTHALIRYCDECGTEVPKYVPHNCPPSDRPYTDEGDPDTHSRLVRCADCGFWVPQQQAHTWVHDSYRKDDTDGGEEGHIEVMKCSVCGAKKEVRQPHGAGTHVAYRQDGNADTHIEVLQCPLCNETFETEQPHEMEHVSCRNDGDTATHIELLKCAQCEAEAERREAHKPMHLYWKSISDTQDQETVRCNMCELTYTYEPAKHTFDTYSYDTNGFSGHNRYKACSKCGERQMSSVITENHIFEGGPNCVKCQQHWEHNHVFWGKIKKWVPLNENQHIGWGDCWYEMDGCEVLCISYGSERDHQYDPLTMKCIVCGYLKEGCEHSNTYKPVSSEITAEQHTVIGTCTKCGKQITLTGAHDMKFVSRSGYEPCENGHTYIDTYRCSFCGYETEEKNSEEHTIWSVAECIDDKTHREKCELCSYTGVVAHDYLLSPLPDECRFCKWCGYDADHVYKVIHNRGYDNENYHDATYECICCHNRKEVKNEPHKYWQMYCIKSADEHLIRNICDVCGHELPYIYQPHDFDEQGVCTGCGYHRGDEVSEVLLFQAGLTEDPGDGTAVTPVFCHLTAEGKEMPFGYELILSDEAASENVNAFSFIILPESISGDPVADVCFTVPELELLQVLGVKNVYIRLSDTDLLLLSDIGQTLTTLSEQEAGELIITLTPGSDGVYTAQYDPAGVYITE